MLDVEGGLGCAVCDLRSGALLAVAHHVPYFTQEYLEAVAAAAVEMFRGHTVRHVEDLISARRGRPSELLIEEVQMTTRHTIHFMMVLPNHPKVVVVLRRRCRFGGRICRLAQPGPTSRCRDVTNRCRIPRPDHPIRAPK